MRKVIFKGQRFDYFRIMAEINKPIKRSAQLAVLSREHHDVLLFCWKIKQGLGNGTDEAILRDFTSWYWQHHIKLHFHQEETVLLPYLSGHSFAGQLRKEHDGIRELFLALEKNADVNTFPKLTSLITDHIRFEERHVFGYLEKTLSEEQLHTIAEDLASFDVLPLRAGEFF